VVPFESYVRPFLLGGTVGPLNAFIMDLQLRQGGKLPEIDIAGTKFYVEVHWGQLRADFRSPSTIKLDDCELSPDGGHYRFAFNTDTKQLAAIDPMITTWPKNVVIVEIPNEVKLDPYAYARKNGLDPIEFVNNHPFEKELKGKIIPIKVTKYQQVLDENNKRSISQKKSRGLHK
jgi:hypothetical protein